MKTKRILAIVLAALFVFTIIPAAVFAQADPAPEKGADAAVKAETLPEKPKEEIALLGDNLFINGTDLYYTNGSPGFTAQQATTDGTTYYWIESNNYHLDSSEALFIIDSFHMNNGETLTFQYWYETEANYDKFELEVNGTVVFSKSGSSNGWESYTYTCPSTGDYQFDFSYKKDSTTNTGADCVRLGYMTYSRQADFYMNRAALNKGMAGNIISVTSTGTYPFGVKATDNASHELYLYSGNKGVASSTSTLTAKVWVEQAPVDFSFDYAVESEQGYDYFKFKVNGTVEFSDSGAGDYTWKTHSYTVTQPGLYTFTFEYSKDGSTNSGEDVVCIDNLRLSQEDATQRALDYNYFYPGDSSNLNAVGSDAWLTFNSPAGNIGFVGTNNSNGNDYRVINQNRFVDSSTSYIETIVNMAEGERITFQYIVSCEEDYDGLSFKVNGATKLFATGWQQSSWATYTYTATMTGTHVLRWEYSKDNTRSEGYDYAMIDSVTYYGSHSYGNASDGWGYHNAFTPEDALIDSSNNGAQVNVSSFAFNGNEYFLPYNDGNGDCMISRNKYYESTSAFLDAYCFGLTPGDQIRFEYTVRSESADKLRIILDAAGTSNDVNQLINGNYSDTWHTFTWTCTAVDDPVVRFEFAKDGSVDTLPDCCMIRNFAVIKAPDPGLNAAMNATGSDINFTSGGVYKWESGYIGSTLCGVPTNRGNLSGSSDTCTATVTATVFMDYGSTFRFDYICDLNNCNYTDWTPEFTCTVAAAGTSTVLALDDAANVTNWTTKTYRAFTSGLYTFTWTYTRPQKGWEFAPNDIVGVRNCSVATDAGIEWPEIDDALNVSGGNLHFSNNNVWSDWWNDDDIVTSATWGESNTNATLTTSVQMAAGDKLRFQYFVSSEQDYDYLVFRVNNSEVFQESGLIDWEWYEWTAPSAGTYQFEWTYHKDGSVDRGMDCFKLDYVELVQNGTPGGPGNGDVDGNGNIAVTDAILAMRHAMGLLTLNSEQLARGDVNGDGVVTVVDAITILRKAMGLIP